MILEAVLRGMAIGALAATGVGLARGAGERPAGIAGAVFAASICGYAVNSSVILREAVGPLAIPSWLLSMGGVGWFWLFVATLFEDRRLDWRTLAPPAGLTILGAAAFLAEGPIEAAGWVAHNLIEIALGGHALWIIRQSWRGDLVEARRRLRGPFMAAIVALVVAFAAVEIGESFGVVQAWYSLAAAGLVSAFALAGAGLMLSARADLFGAAAPAANAAPDGGGAFDAADRVTLQRLSEAMERDEAWRREGLTIGALADLVGTPEHRLRRLINDGLGWRNFAAYLNAQRIAAAKRALADPLRGRETVAAIAFSLGYGSLGPFNRAFKDETGTTPTQWRRQALQTPSPET